MGISLWLPRSPLPNAQAPRWIPDPESAEASVAETSAAQPVSQRSPQAAAELMREAFGTQSKPSQAEAHPPEAMPASAEAVSPEHLAKQPDHKEPAPVSPVTLGTEARISGEGAGAGSDAQLSAGQPRTDETAKPGPAVTPRFQLNFVKASERGLWVCDADSDPEHLQGFIQRVMAAWQESVVFMNKVPGFRWPFIASRHQDQSEPVALQALTAQWQVLRPQEGEGYTIALGEDAAHWLQRIGVAPLVCLPDLATLQSAADAKRRLWLALQALDTL